MLYSSFRIRFDPIVLRLDSRNMNSSKYADPVKCHRFVNYTEYYLTS